MVVSAPLAEYVSEKQSSILNLHDFCSLKNQVKKCQYESIQQSECFLDLPTQFGKNIWYVGGSTGVTISNRVILNVVIFNMECCTDNLQRIIFCAPLGCSNHIFVLAVFIGACYLNIYTVKKTERGHQIQGTPLLLNHSSGYFKA
eukprot:EC095398.1.p2 GENE.EC095398.1~~EC095398.1.p2  ORF type:complete len:145 (+),score=6.63 EC095398.1:111-545(+)